MNVEAVAATGGELGGGERHADALGAALADEGEQRPPAAAEVEDPPSGPDPDPLGDELVLSPLRLLEREREVTVVLGAAEVGQLAEAEPEDPVDQRVGEVEILAAGHGSNLSSGASVVRRGPAPSW